MSAPTKESLAALLNGRMIGCEITDDEISQAEKDGLVVLFGYSDDNAELRGAIHDEIGVYNGDTFKVTPKGVLMLPDREETEVLKRFKVLELVENSGKEIEARWCKDAGYSWTYATDIPHATFDIIENDGSGEKFCRGIVFSITDIATP